MLTKGLQQRNFYWLNQQGIKNRIVFRNVKLIWFRWWKMWVSKSNWRYGKIGWNMNSCFQQEKISERSWLKREWVLIQLSTTKSIAGETGCAQPAEFSWWTRILLRHTGMIVSPGLSDIPDLVVRLKSGRIWKSKFLQNGYGEKEEKNQICNVIFSGNKGLTLSNSVKDSILPSSLLWKTRTLWLRVINPQV